MAMTRLTVRALLTEAVGELDPNDVDRWGPAGYGRTVTARLLTYRTIERRRGNAGYALTMYGRLVASTAALFGDACDFVTAAGDDPDCRAMDVDSWQRACRRIEETMAAITVAVDGPVTVVVAATGRTSYEREVWVAGRLAWLHTAWTSVDPRCSPDRALRFAAADAADALGRRQMHPDAVGRLGTLARPVGVES